METKNICGKIPVELHEKVREELEGTEMTIPQFFTKGYRRAFYEKRSGKDGSKNIGSTSIRGIIQPLKRESRKGETPKTRAFTQKDYLIEIITQALDAADELEKQDEDEPELHVTQPEELELENEERLQEAESEEETE